MPAESTDTRQLWQHRSGKSKAMIDCHNIIIGAGIGGLTAALSLQHHGFKVTVCEQASELKEVGAGLVLTPNAMRALNFLGVGDAIAGRDVGRDPAGEHDPGNQLREVTPDLTRMLEVHDVPLSSKCTGGGWAGVPRPVTTLGSMGG